MAWHIPNLGGMFHHEHFEAKKQEMDDLAKRGEWAMEHHRSKPKRPSLARRVVRRIRGGGD